MLIVVSSSSAGGHAPGPCQAAGVLTVLSIRVFAHSRSLDYAKTHTFETWILTVASQCGPSSRMNCAAGSTSVRTRPVAASPLWWTWPRSSTSPPRQCRRRWHPSERKAGSVPCWGRGRSSLIRGPDRRVMRLPLPPRSHQAQVLAPPVQHRPVPSAVALGHRPADQRTPGPYRPARSPHESRPALVLACAHLKSRASCGSSRQTVSGRRRGPCGEPVRQLAGSFLKLRTTDVGGTYVGESWLRRKDTRGAIPPARQNVPARRHPRFGCSRTTLPGHGTPTSLDGTLTPRPVGRPGLRTGPMAARGLAGPRRPVREQRPARPAALR